MSASDLRRLLEFLRDDHGVDLSAVPEPVVRSRFERLMRRLGVTSATALQSILELDVRERISALVDLTRRCRHGIGMTHVA